MNSHEWTIRQAAVDEIERLVDLRMAMFDSMDLLDEENRERTRDDCCVYFKETLPVEVFRVWIAEIEGEPIASIGLVVHSIPPSMFNRVGKEGYIMNLVTLPAWRRRGIARALLEHVLDVLRSEGVPIASLHASRNGRSLYEDLGFKTREDLPEMRLPL